MSTSLAPAALAARRSLSARSPRSLTASASAVARTYASSSSSPTTPPEDSKPRGKAPVPYSTHSQSYAETSTTGPNSTLFAKLITPAIAKKIAPLFGLDSKAQTHQRETLYMYERCAAGATVHLDWLVREAGLPDTFQTWFSATQVHVWMVMVRLRAEGEVGKEATKGVVSHMFRDMEDRLWAMGIRRNAIVDKSLKEFLSIFYGGILSYDEALTHSDALLASALWRNLFQSHPSVDLAHVAEYVRLVRRELQLLEAVERDEVIKGRWRFAHEAEAEAQGKVRAGQDDDVKPLSPDEMRALQQHLGRM
ncbi:ubiquinol-cytochrome C chaperone-domain-containing protein [Catenaria anguillulae PL171]|uniref:Ubiquinol-cytochrome C chaperone-domain-containing protein n=1 Tax=Catenaria anguillulae PL171 TaxID=765915 RepID=A0A1Y2HGL8_9FUNG|nr:ubiquinol-cytochrome C chaperone-domain-containing protein [Catenaria anguillulae PL171]